MHKRSKVDEILSVDNQFLVVLLENGRCTVHNLCKFSFRLIIAESKEVFFFNKSN